MILVTLGTMYLDFARLVHAVDAIALASGERVVVQRGLSHTIPAHCEHFDFRPRTDLLALHAETRLVVCHAGIGAVMDALQAHKPIIVVPRRKHLGEHNNDHQLEVADAVVRRGWGQAVHDIAELAAACAFPPAAKLDYQPDSARLFQFVRQQVFSAVERAD